MLKQTLSLILLLMFCFSCVYNHTSNTENLGNGYFFLGDGTESQILLGDEKKNSGSTIIPHEVTKYNFDSHYIIAKTLTITGKKKNQLYWIVNKLDKREAIYAFDSLSFAKKTHQLNINLILKERK